LRDEIARYFRIGQALFTELFAAATPSEAATTRFVEVLLRDVFGLGDISRVGARMLGERSYPVTLEGRAGRVPVVVVPSSDALDAPSPHLPSEGRRRSAASALQDWLNAGDGAQVITEIGIMRDTPDGGVGSAHRMSPVRSAGAVEAVSGPNARSLELLGAPASHRSSPPSARPG
jgi:hypothetical protein